MDESFLFSNFRNLTFTSASTSSALFGGMKSEDGNKWGKGQWQVTNPGKLEVDILTLMMTVWKKNRKIDSPLSSRASVETPEMRLPRVQTLKMSSFM